MRPASCPGYLVQLTSDVEALDGPSGPAADFTDLHAWAEVYIPGAGWIGLDPTSGLFAGEGHIPLSATPHPESSAPITGATEPCETTLDFSNIVTRVHEDPRVTLPYTEAAWGAICALGARVDERLAAGDVRLTVGGEPTFVSIDNQVDPEWTTDADGPHKRQRASELAARLKKVWAPQGLVQRSQGKWYPGEPLPRWQIGLFWRTDGEPLWRNAELLADPWSSGAADDDVAPTPGCMLLGAIADGLGLPASQVRPAYEDALSRLAGTVRQPAGEPVGAGGRSGRRCRRPAKGTVGPARGACHRAGRLRATAASPRRRFGLGQRRLAAAARPHRAARGRLACRAAVAAELHQLASARASVPGRPARQAWQAAGGARTRRCIGRGCRGRRDRPRDGDGRRGQARNDGVGLLYIFVPPTEALEDFVDLVTRIEAAAAKVDCQVVVEGYGPPPDSRLQSMSVTPDPGVIEVNVAPTASFAAQKAQLETLYEQARLARLSTEAFDFDGTHGGTGGGNHITLGGITPADSPLLRRPDLLVSLLTYWQRHPSLSYLFAGPVRRHHLAGAARRRGSRRGALRAGDRVRRDRATGVGQRRTAKPWITDRALRHLLTDITGNTHRAEFCIDKLYSPDSARGRLGLLELRGFEMPPHYQMAMVQSLLVRALVAWFWDEPLRAPLIRHGANLHGRYLLPHFLIHDIADVAADLRAHGINFDTSWLDPFTEFRFPRIGTAVFDGVEIELRGAIEPWNTLGEESTAGGTARYVDSSVERIQVRLIGADRHRYVVTANGYPIPLLATDNPDVQVGGVRFRAWQPPSALHPTITVDGPLRFELVDSVTGMSRGGCTYHVSHPGGRAYDNPPVNAVEAESRRGRRFEATGFTPGKVDMSDIREKQARQSTDVGAPGILDLRRVRTVLQ